MVDGLPIPPPELRFMTQTEAEYRQSADMIVAEFAELTDLQPSDAVLDVGSGYGRIADGLWRRGHRAPYVGMDILPRHIAWCSQEMTPATDGLYTFTHLDVRNERYNPGGHISPTDVDLDVGIRPDAVILNSVFTHMHRAEIVHYLRELERILAPDGRIVATFFLINQSQQAFEAAGRSTLPLTFRIDEVTRCWSIKDPLHVIGYYQTWVERVVHDAGFAVASTRFGSWCGRREPRFQDTMTLVRRS